MSLEELDVAHRSGDDEYMVVTMEKDLATRLSFLVRGEHNRRLCVRPQDSIPPGFSLSIKDTGASLKAKLPDIPAKDARKLATGLGGGALRKYPLRHGFCPVRNPSTAQALFSVSDARRIGHAV